MYINREEALRYLGYQGQKLDDQLQALLDMCLAEVGEAAKEHFVYEVFDVVKTKKGLHMKGSTLLLPGEAIGTHLAKAEKCAVLAVTLGLEVDKRIGLYSRTSLTKALFFDACATAAVEALCDRVQDEIERKAKAMKLEITSRYSPGYGDFSLESQKRIAEVLKVYEKIGLSVNEQGIMIPRKSITAVIGMQPEKCSAKEHKCKGCENKDCIYRKDDSHE